MSERFETKSCIKAQYKYLSFPFLSFPFLECMSLLCSPRCSMRILRLSTQDLLTVPRCKTVFGGRRFSVAAPVVWNGLPHKLRNCETLGTFNK